MTGGLNVPLFFLECPEGFYKPEVGNQPCRKCGNNTLVARRTKCECLEKYYRAIGKEDDDKADCFRKWNLICSQNIQWTAIEQILTKDSRSKVFWNKGVSINFAKFTRKHLCQKLFFDEVAGLQPVTYSKKFLPVYCFRHAAPQTVWTSIWVCC